MQHKKEMLTQGRSKEEEDKDKKKKKKKVEVVAVAVPKTRHVETLQYIEKKLTDKGLHRMDRHPVDGLGGIGRPPPKSGHGGKFTWEGPDDTAESELNPIPPAIDPNDPNYEEESMVAVVDEDVEDVVVGEVEVAKVAEAKEGVSRIEVEPTLKPVLDE